MLSEVLQILGPKPGEVAVDCTLGYGGHAAELLPRLLPKGRLLGLDVDPVELPKTEARLRALGFGPEVFSAHGTNFAGLPNILATAGMSGADMILADLGVSSMQLDDPARGFSMKYAGPLDMRMNPQRGQPASRMLKEIRPSRWRNSSPTMPTSRTPAVLRRLWRRATSEPHPILRLRSVLRLNP